MTSYQPKTPIEDSNLPVFTPPAGTATGLVSHSDPWWKTFMTSYSGGFITVVAGHPFDTIKIRMQTGTTKSLFRHLYRGVVPPLITTPPSWSLQFLLYQASMKIFANDSLSNVAFAGGLSGFIWATVVTPPELIKCYAQRWHLTTPDAMREIYHNLGGSMRSYIVKGLFRGYTAALIRDVPGCMAYMWAMEVPRRYIPNYNNSPVLGPFIAGMSAGTFCWIFAFPADTIKSIIQTDIAASRTTKELPSASFVYNVKKLLAENNGNFLRLYRGYGWIVARSVVTQGAAIVGVENVSRFINSLE